MTNEKITEILDRCNGRFGWVQIHIDTEENYLLMPRSQTDIPHNINIVHSADGGLAGREQNER